MSNLYDVVREHYGVQATDIKQITDKAYQIVTAQASYVLKFIAHPSVVDHKLFAYREMPDHILPIYETTSGSRVANLGDQAAILTPYVQEIPVPYEKRVSDYMALLLRLHVATRIDIEKNQTEIQAMYEADLARLSENFLYLEETMKRIEYKLSRSPFEWYVLMVYPTLYNMYRRADDVLKRYYRKLSRRGGKSASLLHVDVNVANFLPGATGTYLINFEKSRIDSPAYDMASFLKHYHHLPGARHILMQFLQNEKDFLTTGRFFFEGLCLDLIPVFEKGYNNALGDISVFNEYLAPGILAMRLYDDLYLNPEAEQGPPAGMSR